ncbi:MAG: SAP domain-containing protein [Oscillospiraceae bacterium]|nr:SAP domain-containing protein [Oscillospiraceae bacterium]
MGILDFLKRKEDEAPGQQGQAEQAASLELQDFLAPGPYEASPEGLTPAGLYPHEVLLLSAASSFYTDQQKFPTTLRQQYGMLDVRKLLLGLVERGFLESATLEATLEGETVVNLKKTLKACGLPVGGRKAELIERIATQMSDADLATHFPRRAFALTQSGKQAVAEAQYVPYVHRRPVEGLTIWEMHRLALAEPDKTYRGLILAYMERRSQFHFNAKDYNAYRAMRYRMYQFMLEENKLKKAFPFLVETMYYDLSGMDSEQRDPIYQFVSEKYFFPYDKSIVKLSATVVNAMTKLQEDLRLTEGMLRALLLQFFSQYKLPFHLFTHEECAVVILLELRGDKDKLRQVYELAEARFGKGK